MIPDKPKHGGATDRWVLLATITASAMGFIMQTAISIVQPALQKDLNASGAEVLWVINAFQLMLGALILVGGSLGDIYGRKRVFGIGIVIFAVASLACGVAPTIQLLIAARIVQGIGGALMIPGSLAIIAAYFPDATRGQAIGTWSAFTTMTSILGPVIGGYLAEGGLWRLVFFMNIPLALLALAVLIVFVPESRDEEASPYLDIPGAILITLSLASIVYGATELGRTRDNTNLLLIGVGFVLFLLFLFVEARSSHPLMPLGLFRSRTFSGTNLLTLFAYGALAGATFFIPFNLVLIQGYPSSAAGVAMLPPSLILIGMSRWSGGLVVRYGAKLPLTVGPFLIGVGFILLALPDLTRGMDDYLTTYLPGMVVFGLGLAIMVAPLTATVMGAVPIHNAGVASGINNAVSRAAGVLAVAFMGGLALVFFQNALTLQSQNLPAETRTALIEGAGDLANTQVPAGTSAEVAAQAHTAIQWAFIETFRVMMFIAAGLCWLSALMALMIVENRPRRLEAA